MQCQELGILLHTTGSKLIRELLISRYCQHYLNCTPHDRSANVDAIIPDILIHNCPAESERRRDGNGISQASAPTIFE
eukprot:10774535-Ditylum_brightwellii.AAC.1